MADYPYILVPKKLQDFMGHIQSAGVPPKITVKYIKGLGFTSSNDERIIPVLRSLGFIDSAGVPTKNWKEYRNKEKAAAVLANAIRQAYADLFAMYTDANQRDTQALRNFFSSQTTVAARALSAMVSTFQTLCSLARFDEVAPAEGTPPAPPPAAKILGLQSLTINLQLTLPETTNTSIYEEIFKAMKKYLLEASE